jgi:hypothetical protein
LSYLNTFKGQYYGPLASDPTVDPLGAAMTAGDLYWNTTASLMKTYTGSAWIAAYIPVTGYALSGANSDITSLSGLTTPLSVGQGGTGNTTYTNGQLLIGNTTGNTLTKATLTAGSGITITNGDGSITIDAASSSGTGSTLYLNNSYGGF